MTTTWTPTAEERRQVIAFVEMLGLLHDIGKLTDDFLKSQSADYGEGPNKYKFWYSLVAAPPSPPSERPAGELRGLGDLLRHIQQLQTANLDSDTKKAYQVDELAQIRAMGAVPVWDGQSYTISELLTVAEPGLAGIPSDTWRAVFGKSMQPAVLVGSMHGRAHFEKEDPAVGVPGSRPLRVRQPYLHTYRSSPFGDETRIKVGPENTEERSEIGLNARYRKLAEALSISNRMERLAVLRTLMSAGLGDTQRPTNEVTLWDWGYTVATLAKAAVNWIAQNGWPTNLGDIAFRTLAVTLNRLEQYANADKLTDIVGLRETLDAAYAKVRRVVEEELALGNRFYHDETGSYFLVAGTMSVTDDLSRRIADCFPADLRPHIRTGESVKASQLDPRASADPKAYEAHLSIRVKASQLDPRASASESLKAVSELVAKPRRRAQQQPLPHFAADGNMHVLAQTWEKDARPTNAERCSMCGLRPVGYPYKLDAAEPNIDVEEWADGDKAKRRNVCRVCLSRRGRTAKTWAQGGMQRTIWLDEAADDNGRLALFVGELGLDGWLDGGLLATLKVREAANGNPPLYKNPSPARLYRIAETGRAFWRETINGLESVAGQQALRLALHPAAGETDRLAKTLARHYAYELDVDGVMLAVMWDGQKFVTAENLAYFVKRWKPDEKAGDDWLQPLKDKLTGGAFSVMEPTGYGEASFAQTQAVIGNVEPLAPFAPTIGLMAEPSLCMALIPADKALALAKAVRDRYNQQMGRVKDRLPLHMGLVFFPRRTPIRAVLAAGRRMLGMGDEWRWEQWTVKEDVKATDSSASVTFDKRAKWNTPTVPGDGQTADRWDSHYTVQWDVPLKAGDGQTADKWYPYFVAGETPPQRADSNVPTLVHVSELKMGDRVWVRPSRFDYEYLDTTARVHDIRYTGPDATRATRLARPYRLEDLDGLNGRSSEQSLWHELSQLNRTQRYQIVQTIEATAEAWGLKTLELRKGQPVFERFVEDTLAGAAWPKARPWKDIANATRNKLVCAGVTGELADIVEIYMQILKEPEPKRNGQTTPQAVES
jgi:hypothetical protein